MSTNSQDWGHKLPQTQRDAIQKLVDSGRILPIEEGGITSPIWDYMKRPMAMVKYGDTYVPHYISSGLGGKKTVATGMWYPIAGIGIDSDWLNKGSSSQINKYYDDPTLQKLANILDTEIGNVDHSLLPRVPFDSMSFPRKVNDLVGVGPGLENWPGGDVNDPLTATSNRIGRRFSNIAYKARGYTNLPYPDIRERETSADFKAEYASKTGTSIPQPVQPTIDIPLNMIGESSEWTPRRFSEGLTPHESKALLEVYDNQGGKATTSVLNTVYSKKPITPVSNPVSIKEQLSIPPTVVTDIGVSNNATSGIDSSKSAKQVHVETHDKLQTNSLKNFFGGNSLLSFDTETTNLDNTNEIHAKRGRIWQLGLATSGGIDGLEEHVNPFFSTNAKGELVQSGKVREIFLRDMLKQSNGQFSARAYDAGNFETFIKQYNKGGLSSLDNAITKTLGSIDHGSAIVLQNMNFENSVLKSAVEQGILSEDIYKNIAGRMRTVGTDSVGNVTQLFQRPSEVVSKVREADMIYHTSYLTSKDPSDFTEYKNLLNEAVDSYAHTLSDPKRSGVVAIELQDITKAFLANAAEAGRIDKKTATLGLNMEFLTKTVLNEPEAHTALSDSKQTISLLQNLWGMTEELRSGEISERTEGILSNIRQNQGVEVNKRFISSVRSVLSDFKQSGGSNITSASNWYQPRAILKEVDNEGRSNKVVIDRVSSSGGRRRTVSLPEALSTVLKRYSEYNDNLYDFSRKGYVENIIKEHTEGANVAKLHTRVEGDFFKIEPPKVLNTTENYLTNTLSKSVQASDYWKESVNFLGKTVERKTRATVLGAVGAGLAFMAFQDRPAPVDKDYDNVAQNFYDDQYLGTAFVDFRERNKHYMM